MSNYSQNWHKRMLILCVLPHWTHWIIEMLHLLQGFYFFCFECSPLMFTTHRFCPICTHRRVWLAENTDTLFFNPLEDWEAFNFSFLNITKFRSVSRFLRHPSVIYSCHNCLGEMSFFFLWKVVEDDLLTLFRSYQNAWYLQEAMISNPELNYGMWHSSEVENRRNLHFSLLPFPSRSIKKSFMSLGSQY